MFKRKSEEEKQIAFEAGQERNRLFNEKLAAERQRKKEKSGKVGQTKAIRGRPINEREAEVHQAIEERKAQFSEGRADTHLAKEERKIEKEERKLRKKEDQALAESKTLKSFGTLVLDVSPGPKRVRLYSKGYVSISGLFSSEKTPEKLIAVSLRSNAAKKTGLGRAVTAVATGGANIVLSGNTRGDMYLSITTDKTVHLIHSDRPQASEMKRFAKVEAMALALIQNPGAFEERTQV